jgi:hypothetical protein
MASARSLFVPLAPAVLVVPLIGRGHLVHAGAAVAAQTTAGGRAKELAGRWLELAASRTLSSLHVCSPRLSAAHVR